MGVAHPLSCLNKRFLPASGSPHGAKRGRGAVPVVKFGNAPLSLLRLFSAFVGIILTVTLAVSADAQPSRRAAARPAPVASTPALPVQTSPVQPGGVIGAIKVEGNERIETGTIVNYMSVQPGDLFDPDRIDRSLKTLYATGLFSDVQLVRDGSTLIVRVVENPVVNRIAFEGNHTISDDNLRPLVQLKPRAVYSAQTAQADRQRILDAYAKKSHYAATVEPKIIRLDHNRVDVVFEITDGESTLIGRIAFVGNHQFSESRLREVINSREEAWWRFLSTSDSYDVERTGYDKELLRRFYLKNGYADFKVVDSTAELSPDRRSFLVTYVLDEGARYRVGKVDVDSKLRNVTSDSLKPIIEISPGDWYDGDAVERTVKALSAAARDRGNPFVEVTPRVSRKVEDHIIDLRFDVTDGPHVYVERINITGNTRTRDSVIRRELLLSEGDPFNADLLRDSRQHLQDMGFFDKVDLTSGPGSAPDRTIVNMNVQDKATGEISLGGGYSTDIGPLVNVGLHERNLVGTGIDAGINGLVAQYETQISASVTDPYFLGRDLSAGADVFDIVNNNQFIAEYNENRLGMTLRMGYNYNAHLSQSWNYSIVTRSVYGVQSFASAYIQDQAGTSLLSQIGTSIQYDQRDSRLTPHTGYLLRVGADYAGLGGTVDYVRSRVDAGYWVPLDYFTGNSDWGLQFTAGSGYLASLNGQQTDVIDRFFLGGDNLRGFEIAGAGPHELISGDSLGGNFIWTQSTELHFPLPISQDLGLTGRAFVDIGALSQTSKYIPGTLLANNPAPRASVGVGVGWNTPFGLINLDLGFPVIKYNGDVTQVFRFGFGTNF